MSDLQTTPYGYCHCGCGEKTPLAAKTSTRRGHVRGEPLRFVHGHNGRAQRRSPEERFWKKVGRADPDQCWEWLGTRNDRGYGRFAIPSPTGGMRQVRAYRFAYELLVGAIPEGLEIDHLCRNRGCVNPAHLEPVTHRENMFRARQTHCKHGHEFTEANSYLPPSGGRECRLCQAAHNRRYRRRKKAA
jgi:hypothetical protein